MGLREETKFDKRVKKTSTLSHRVAHLSNYDGVIGVVLYDANAGKIRMSSFQSQDLKLEDVVFSMARTYGYFLPNDSWRLVGEAWGVVFGRHDCMCLGLMYKKNHLIAKSVKRMVREVLSAEVHKGASFGIGGSNDV